MVIVVIVGRGVWRALTDVGRRAVSFLLV